MKYSSRYLFPVVFTLLFSGANLFAQNAGKGDKSALENILKDRLLLLVFFAPDCPLCQNYTAAITTLRTQYHDKLLVCVLFPGYTSDARELELFKKEYRFDAACIGDKKLKKTKLLGASVTPEVMLLSSAGKLLYRGAIDNWMYAPGQKRQVVTEFYLADALQNVMKKKQTFIEKTTAYGCVIN